jgi:hypothetical protein
LVSAAKGCGPSSSDFKFPRILIPCNRFTYSPPSHVPKRPHLLAIELL